MNLNIKTFILGPLFNNSYLIWDETLKGAVIDPSFDSEIIIGFSKNNNIMVEKVLLTHAHFDHVAGANLFKKFFNSKIFLNKKDLPLLREAKLTAQKFGFFMEAPPPVDSFIGEGEELDVGSFKIKVLETPGHTPGGISFYILNHIFTGDTLFKGSIGRTDLEGGNFEELLNSIKNKIFSLPSETLVHPGHGEETILKDEFDFNPFLR